MGYSFDPAAGLGSGINTGLATAALGMTGPLGPILTLGMTALGGLRKKQQSQIPWGQVVTHPEYAHTRQRLAKTSDFLTDNIDRLAMGEEMPWISRYFEGSDPSSGGGITAGLQKQLRDRTFGSGTQQGDLDIAAQTGSISGVGPKATQANVNKAMVDYQNKAAAIDTAIAELRAGMQHQAATEFPRLAMAMPRGPEISIVGGGGGGYQPPASSASNNNLNYLSSLAESGALEGLWGKTPKISSGLSYADRFDGSILPWNNVQQSTYGSFLDNYDFMPASNTGWNGYFQSPEYNFDTNYPTWGAANIK